MTRGIFEGLLNNLAQLDARDEAHTGDSAELDLGRRAGVGAAFSAHTSPIGL